MWLDYAIAFGGLLLVGVAVVVLHTILLNQIKAEREAERSKEAQQSTGG